MKTNKSVENVEVTPSKKKLTQARLPFKIISEDAASVVPPSRKRKLSSDGSDATTKIGKLSKENDLIDDLVVISDDDSKDSQTKIQNAAKKMNPFVKLVDNAFKKKLQKTKSPKKRKSARNSLKQLNGVIESKEASDDTVEQEKMEVDTENDEESAKDSSLKESQTESSKANNIKDVEENVVVLLEDSNDAVNIPDKKASTKGNKAIDTEEPVDSNTKTVENIDETMDDASGQKPEPVTPKTAGRKTKSDDKDKNSSTTKDGQVSDTKDALDDNKKPLSPKTTGRKAKSEARDKLNSSTTKNGRNIPERVDTTESHTEVSTPKSQRKAKSEAKDKLNSSTTSVKLNESVCSSPSTPKRSSRSSSVTNSLNDSISEANTSANLTPKQLQKKLESTKKKEEREKEKQEREKKRQEEKEERAKQKQEKEDAKKREREEKEEQKKKEREEKEEQKKKEREEKEKQKELEKKLREEKEEQKKKEKEEKEEQRRKEKEARDEEKRKKQEALELEKLEQELKKKKAAEAFVNFFVPKQKEKDQPTAGPASQNSVLSSFNIKGDMRLAPIVRGVLSDEQKLAMESMLKQQKLKEVDLYLKNLKKEETKIGSSGKTWPLTDRDDNDDVMIVEDELPAIDGTEEVACESAAREKLRPKLFSFHENKRPPYWGTWRKRSTCIKPRRPFGQENQLDYDVDSDEDWEEEQEGESLDGSAAGSDEEPEDDYEVDNEVFVPHGYLSDEEATMDEDDVLSLSPETQKARLKNLEDEFESEMKKPTEKLKPRLYGILWETKDGGKPEKCVDALWSYFGKMAMIMDDPTSLLQPPSEPQEPEKKKVKKKKTLTEGEQQSPKSDKKKKPKPENKDSKKSKPESKTPEVKKNQPGINSFLTKLKST